MPTLPSNGSALSSNGTTLPSTGSSLSTASAKKVVFLALENVLIPGEFISDVNLSSSKRFLQSFFSFARKKGLSAYLLSSHSEKWAREKVVELGWEIFFSPGMVFGVNDDYLSKMEPIDRARYDEKCKENPACTDEYYKQVAMLEVMKKNTHTAGQCVLLGNDYWFDGFYTRRYALVDVVFIEPSLTTRGKPIVQKISGLWYASLSLKSIQPFLEGRVARPNYAPLDTWASVTLTEELLGAQNFNQVKRVILERKKDGSIGPSSGDPLPPTS